MISSIVQIRSLYLLISFTLVLLVSVYLIATKKQKLPPVIIFRIITILLVLCLAFFIRQLFNQENKYLFFLQVACLAISLVCVVVLVITSYFYDDIFDKNNASSSVMLTWGVLLYEGSRRWPVAAVPESRESLVRGPPRPATPAPPGASRRLPR